MILTLLKEEMLSAVASKQLSLAEMKDKAGKYRGMQAIMQASILSMYKHQLEPSSTEVPTAYHWGEAVTVS